MRFICIRTLFVLFRLGNLDSSSNFFVSTCAIILFFTEETRQGLAVDGDRVMRFAQHLDG